MGLQKHQFEKVSQPHLPGMHVKPLDEARWPKGYSPERRDEVRSALSQVDVHDARQRVETYASQYHHHIGQSATPRFADAVESTIARSTMPVEHLEGLKAIRNTNHTEVPGASGNFTQHDYEFRGPVVRMNIDHGTRQGVNERTSREETLLHELGHHVHFMGRTGEPGEWSDRKRKQVGPDPVLEARAEEYGRQHWRQDPRAARRNPVEYDASYDRISDKHVGWSYDDRAQFNEIYHGDARKPSVSPETSGQRLWRENGGSLEPGRAQQPRGQGRLFMRTSDQMLTDTTYDYGQHSIYHEEPTGEFYNFKGADGLPSPKMTERKVSTIRVGRGPHVNPLQVPGAPDAVEYGVYDESGMRKETYGDRTDQQRFEHALSAYREQVLTKRSGVTPKKRKGKG